MQDCTNRFDRLSLLRDIENEMNVALIVLALGGSIKKVQRVFPGN